jgi:hypothetical protein
LDSRDISNSKFFAPAATTDVHKLL